MIFLSGTWGLSQGYPILIVNMPLMTVGISVLWFLKRTKKISSVRVIVRGNWFLASPVGQVPGEGEPFGRDFLDAHNRLNANPMA